MVGYSGGDDSAMAQLQTILFGSLGARSMDLHIRGAGVKGIRRLTIVKGDELSVRREQRDKTGDDTPP